MRTITHDVEKMSSFFDMIHQDPVISQVKLIAEPWDIGEGGYQVGNFPPGWAMRSITRQTGMKIRRGNRITGPGTAGLKGLRTIRPLWG
jgi:pullulanase/glycogen debranching enzyme